MEFYTYFRSSAAYRVRIALNLKGLAPTMIPIHLVKGGGEHLTEKYRALNPNAVVPTLIDGGAVLNQSLAIMEYLDEVYPGQRLLPADPVLRAQVRSVALTIACDIHPLQNMRVLKYLGGELNIPEGQRNQWYRHWVEQGLQAVEQMLVAIGKVGEFCFGSSPTLADVVLVPQLFNARRVQANLDLIPNLLRIEANCQKLSAFQLAAPALQIDAE